MAYQTNSVDFFDYLNQLLLENKVKETIQILSDASSADPTLNGDLKFLKLRANKKLMVLAGVSGGGSKEQIRDVSKLIKELKKAHLRRNVIVTTLTAPETAALQTVQNNNPANLTKRSKKRSAWPWVLLLLLLGMGAAGYFFKNKILENEYVQKVVPANFLSNLSNDSVEDADSEKTTASKKNKKSKTTPSKMTSNTAKGDLGKWYIQIGSFVRLDQALSKRKRVEMSFDRSIILQKNIGGKANYRIVIPGFSSKAKAESFKGQRKVGNLYTGAFVQPFSRDCRNMAESESHIYICN